MRIGSYINDGSARFCVWAPLKRSMELVLLSDEERTIPMDKDDNGYWTAEAEGVTVGCMYNYRIDGEDTRPDPASLYQPDGVHGPSAVYDHSVFQWDDDGFRPPELEDMIIYELHTGTFTEKGTFNGIIEKLPYLKELGINAIELLPVSQFPGTRNWGYDGVYPFAVQNSYGGPDGLKKLVNACHNKGIAVVMDVVYNHLGPEGNYLWSYGPYFTDRYQTPWGQALNFDGPYSPGVRNYFVENVMHWLRDYHIDALRLDAVHGIYDFGARHILKEMQSAVDDLNESSGRAHYLIAESDLNDPALIRPQSENGYGMAGQWCDDFHHALRTYITQDTTGYYSDFGDFDQIVTSFRQAFVYDWKYSQHRKRMFGESAADRPPGQFVVYIQNHDQIGNRMNGERLIELTSFENCKLAAGAYLLSPYVPMIYMGEEYGEDAPFLYFIDHQDEDLVKAVRQGRKDEFAAFKWEGEPPDPKAEETYNTSRLKWGGLKDERKGQMLDFYKALIRLRKEIPAFSSCDRQSIKIECDREKEVIYFHRKFEQNNLLVIMNFSNDQQSLELPDQFEGYTRLLASADGSFGGGGTVSSQRLSLEGTCQLDPCSLLAYQRND